MSLCILPAPAVFWWNWCRMCLQEFRKTVVCIPSFLSAAPADRRRRRELHPLHSPEIRSEHEHLPVRTQSDLADYSIAPQFFASNSLQLHSGPREKSFRRASLKSPAHQSGLRRACLQDCWSWPSQQFCPDRAWRDDHKDNQQDKHYIDHWGNVDTGIDFVCFAPVYPGHALLRSLL